MWSIMYIRNIKADCLPYTQIYIKDLKETRLSGLCTGKAIRGNK